MTATVDTIEQAAVAYLPRTVILRQRSKAPVFEHWTTRVETRDTLAEWFERHPGSNIGIRTGRDPALGPQAGGLAVLDVDADRGGFESLVVLETNLGRLPATMRVHTGGGGLHVYLRERPGVALASRELLPGLELKAAGCQVCAPPSVHPGTGRVYTFDPAVGFAPEAIATVPRELAELAGAKHAAGDRARVSSTDPLDHIDEAAYITALCGRVPDRRGFIRCPSPGHAGGDEWIASLKLYPAGRGWFCFGCRRGGGITEFAALAAGIPLPLERDVRRALRAELRTLFTVRQAAP